MERLCKTYWYPLYVFVRSKGYGHEDACDLTQEFFARFLEKRYLRSVDEGRGKFRTFLLTSVTHFLANEWDRARTQKRGGGKQIISIDEASAEELFERPGHPYTKGLLGSIPNLEVAAHTRTRRARLNEIKGMVPSLADLPRGCTFAPRCGLASEQCRAAYPPLTQYRPGHWVACWHAERLLGGAA